MRGTRVHRKGVATGPPFIMPINLESLSKSIHELIYVDLSFCTSCFVVFSL